MDKRTALIVIAYGVFLTLVGLAGYLSNPEKAKTALISGGTFGAISVALGLLGARGWAAAPRAMMGVACFLGLIFLWRASASWMAYFGGQPDKLVAASLISAMLAATLALAVYLLRSGALRRQP